MPDTGSQRPSETRGPIFIMGAMGSGTTLLRLMLDSHERIVIPRETGFMRALNANKFIPFKWSGRNWFKRLGWSEEEWDELLGNFYDNAFQRLVEKEGAERWGDKTPYHTWHIDEMARLFPTAQFVGVLRHPGGSVASNITRWDASTDSGMSYTLSKSAYHYLRYAIEIARQAARYPDRFTVLRYEELVLQPEALMRELLEWLGEPWSDSVLKHHEVQASRGGKLQVEGRVRVDDPIDASRISKWTNTLNEKQRRRINRRIGRVGEFWGYSMDDPVSLEPLGSDGRLLVRGEEIGARIGRFQDIDFTVQPPPPIANLYYDPRHLKLTRQKQGEEDVDEEPWPRTRLRRAALPVFKRLPAPARRGIVALARRFWERGLTSGAPKPEKGQKDGKPQPVEKSQNGSGEQAAQTTAKR